MSINFYVRRPRVRPEALSADAGVSGVIEEGGLSSFLLNSFDGGVSGISRVVSAPGRVNLSA
jgi:hypothetical protein